jgi:biotin transport system substrate-specific component
MVLRRAALFTTRFEYEVPMASQPALPSLSTVIWPVHGRSGMLIIRSVLLALIGTALIFVSAKLKVPFYPVPMTMQSMVVLMLGVAYGPRLGAATVALYVLEGALGLPVFTDTPERGLGLAYLMGPTGGYLLGFVAAAYGAGVMAERGMGRTVTGLMTAMILGHVLIFAAGFGWLATLIGAQKAFSLGVLPFIWATLLKSALGAALLIGFDSLLRRDRGSDEPSA